MNLIEKKWQNEKHGQVKKIYSSLKESGLIRNFLKNRNLSGGKSQMSSIKNLSIPKELVSNADKDGTTSLTLIFPIQDGALKNKIKCLDFKKK